jgi:hypothetical protein
LEAAIEGSHILLKQEPDRALPTTFLAWSINLMKDSRKARSKKKAKEFSMLSRFYRILAHKLYWKQREDSSIGFISDFIQEVT